MKLATRASIFLSREPILVMDSGPEDNTRQFLRRWMNIHEDESLSKNCTPSRLSKLMKALMAAQASKNKTILKSKIVPRRGGRRRGNAISRGIVVQFLTDCRRSFNINVSFCTPEDILLENDGTQLMKLLQLLQIATTSLAPKTIIKPVGSNKGVLIIPIKPKVEGFLILPTMNKEMKTEEMKKEEPTTEKEEIKQVAVEVKENVLATSSNDDNEKDKEGDDDEDEDEDWIDVSLELDTLPDTLLVGESLVLDYL